MDKENYNYRSAYAETALPDDDRNVGDVENHLSNDFYGFPASKVTVLKAIISGTFKKIRQAFA